LPARDARDGDLKVNLFVVIASQRVARMRAPMTGSAKQSSFVAKEESWIASSLRSSQ
jgi:hypothetical protein